MSIKMSGNVPTASGAFGLFLSTGVTFANTSEDGGGGGESETRF
jgi:hypothetical protein